MPRKIPVILSIDAEPDPRLWVREEKLPWKGFEETYEFFSRLRPRLASVTGSDVNFSWFFRMDPQVADCYGSPSWAARHYAREIDDLRAHGDEMGLHTHAWRWDKDRQTWIADHGDQEWINHCVKTSFDAYRETFQEQCLAFRFGDGWMNNATLRFVEELGAQFDLTLEPGSDTASESRKRTGEITTGDYPNYADVPQDPYHPLDSDFRKPAPESEQGLWVIPLSAHTFPKTAGPVHKTLHLDVGPELFAEGVGFLLRSLERPYLALAVRSSVSLKPKRMERMIKNFDHLLSRPLASRFVFCKPSEAIEILGLSSGARLPVLTTERTG